MESMKEAARRIDPKEKAKHYREWIRDKQKQEAENIGAGFAVKALDVTAYLERRENLPPCFPSRVVKENLARALAAILEKEGYTTDLKWRVFVWLLRRIKA